MFLFSVVLPLPKLSDEGMRVTIFHLNTNDTIHYDYTCTIKLSLMTLDFRISKLESFSKKEVIIFDMHFFTMTHVVQGLENLIASSLCFVVSIKRNFLIRYS